MTQITKVSIKTSSFMNLQPVLRPRHPWSSPNFLPSLQLPSSSVSGTLIASSFFEASARASRQFNFYKVRVSAQCPIYCMVDLGIFVQHFAQNLSGMGGPTSSKAAARIACKFAGACKLPHLTTHGFNKVKIPWSHCRDITMETMTNQHTEHGQ